MSHTNAIVALLPRRSQELIDRAECVDFLRVATRPQRENSLVVQFETDVSLESVLVNSDCRASEKTETIIRLAVLYRLLTISAWCVPASLLVGAIGRGFAARYGSEAGTEFETEFLGALRQIRDEVLADADNCKESDAA